MFKDRIKWIHVDLPGQERSANSLNIIKYPSLGDLGDELIVILDYLNIKSVICMGQGAGANICARFAIKHPMRCHGIILIHPTCSPLSFIEKLSSWRSKTNDLSYIIPYRFGNVLKRLF
jgi:protein NDRG1